MPPTPNGPRVAAQDDLYTVLLICATALLVIGTVFMAVRSSMLFDTAFPVAG